MDSNTTATATTTTDIHNKKRTATTKTKTETKTTRTTKGSMEATTTMNGFIPYTTNIRAHCAIHDVNRWSPVHQGFEIHKGATACTEAKPHLPMVKQPSLSQSNPGRGRRASTLSIRKSQESKRRNILLPS
jgi:hypothetical protein